MINHKGKYYLHKYGFSSNYKSIATYKDYRRAFNLDISERNHDLIEKLEDLRQNFRLVIDS